jgi:hypothetical protein
MSELDTVQWMEANQQCLIAEFERLKAKLASVADLPAQVAMASDGGLEHNFTSNIDYLTEWFGLTHFERDLLLLCAGAEMDSALAELCAAIHGNSQRQYVSLGLAMNVLEQAHWSALTPARPLRRWRFIEVVEETSLTHARLRIDERVLHFLAGVNYLDTRLQPLLSHHEARSAMADAHALTVKAILQALEGKPAPYPPIQLVGDDADGQKDVAASVADAIGLKLYGLKAEDIPAGAHELDAFCLLWQRESLVLGSGLLIDCAERTHVPSAIRLAERIGGCLFVASSETMDINSSGLRFTVNKPDAMDQRRLWEQALGASAKRINGALEGVSSQFRLSAKTISAVGEAVQADIATSPTPDQALWKACRGLSRRRLDDLAQRVKPVSLWEDLILPEPQKAILSQIAAHVRHRLKVCEEWGFAQKSSRGLGLSTLFAGESGTGKTMAAEVLANELGLDLYRIDLSAIVNKYIGETEKNLRRVFDAAEDSGAILLFDEADALFGKRSEVKDSHDRYANIEVSYLLQRMESYSGLAILTTNLKNALDTAFQRRLRFIVQFPFPDLEQREAIWHNVFPLTTPVDGLNYRKLAQLNVSGGNIRNIALNAAFLAADDGRPVGMEHLLQAAHGEGGKRERPLSDTETRGWLCNE